MSHAELIKLSQPRATPASTSRILPVEDEPLISLAGCLDVRPWLFYGVGRDGKRRGGLVGRD